ncbi:transposase [Streptomonospora alba]|uniref:transposase n=1 Tax=Streptomonospora alba TaxID=183763 RepID=UPI0009FC2484
MSAPGSATHPDGSALPASEPPRDAGERSAEHPHRPPHACSCSDGGTDHHPDEREAQRGEVGACNRPLELRKTDDPWSTFPQARGHLYADPPARAVSGRFGLTDVEWTLLAPLMPDNPPNGKRWADHRRIIDAILYRTRTVVPRRGLRALRPLGDRGRAASCCCSACRRLRVLPAVESPSTSTAPPAMPAHASAPRARVVLRLPRCQSRTKRDGPAPD